MSRHLVKQKKNHHFPTTHSNNPPTNQSPHSRAPSPKPLSSSSPLHSARFSVSVDFTSSGASIPLYLHSPTHAPTRAHRHLRLYPRATRRAAVPRIIPPAALCNRYHRVPRCALFRGPLAARVPCTRERVAFSRIFRYRSEGMRDNEREREREREDRNFSCRRGIHAVRV